MGAYKRMKDVFEQADGKSDIAFGGWDSLHEIGSDFESLIRDVKRSQQWIKDKRIIDAEKVKYRGSNYLNYIQTKLEWMEEKLFSYGHWNRRDPEKFIPHFVRACDICSSPIWKAYRKRINQERIEDLEKNK